MLSEFHKSHIGRVKVSFFIQGPDLDPDELTERTGIKPDSFARRGDERRNYGGQLVHPHRQGFWGITSKGKIDSKDINDHISFLLAIVSPHTTVFLEISDKCKAIATFDVLWESSYLYAGTGPLLSEESIRGISSLNASLGFDIYQIDDPDSEKDECHDNQV